MYTPSLFETLLSYRSYFYIAFFITSVRLMKGDGQSHGAVEVNLNGKWGSVCNQDWDQNDVGM